MAILTRIAKGTALTHTEMDDNFKELDYRLHILASAPQITTDIDDGVLVGSHAWVTGENAMYICTDNTAGAAQWEKQITDLDYYVASVAPIDGTDDITKGFKLGSHWYNEATGDLYIATTMGTGTSVWEKQQKPDYTVPLTSSTTTYTINTEPVASSTMYQFNINVKGLTIDAATEYYVFEEVFTVIVPIDLADSDTVTYVVKTSAGNSKQVTLTKTSGALSISFDYTGIKLDDGGIDTFLEATYDFSEWNTNQTITKVQLSNVL